MARGWCTSQKAPQTTTTKLSPDNRDHLRNSEDKGVQEQAAPCTQNKSEARILQQSNATSPSPESQNDAGCTSGGISSLPLGTAQKLHMAGRQPDRDHLVVLVHGITATVRDWTYVSQQLSARLGCQFLVYASSSNESLKTFQGVDKAGDRLATEVKELVATKPSLKHISVVAHSLGGLIARYAVARLYEGSSLECRRKEEIIQEGQQQVTSAIAENRSNLQKQEGSTGRGIGKIAGLDAACFITLATPHLGVKGKGQLPFLLGFDVLEMIAAPVAPFVIGRTGKQLFLSDGKPSLGKMPLLLRMASRTVSWPGDPPFLQALGAFHTRVAYANAGFDHMVGWQTSSIRRASELPQIPKKSISPKYKHVMLVENCPALPCPEEPLARDGARDVRKDQEEHVAKTDSDTESTEKDVPSFMEMQELMVAGLQTLSWRKVDVSFREGYFPFFAHNNIHVKLHWLHFDGAGVVQHLADTMKELESIYLRSRL